MIKKFKYYLISLYHQYITKKAFVLWFKENDFEIGQLITTNPTEEKPNLLLLRNHEYGKYYCIIKS